MIRIIVLSIVASTFYFGERLVVQGLNHGRDAELGEFPFVMRIQIAEESARNISDDLDHGIVSTGVLVKPTKVLSTCDAVGFFTGQTVNLYNLNRVTIMGGSISKTGAGGQTKAPVNSSVHPFCYYLTVEDTILFDYGMYEVADEFDSPFISPIKHPFRHKAEMTSLMKALWEQRTSLKCKTAGWGNPRKQFEGSGMPDHFERFAPILQATDLEVVTYDHCRTELCNFFGDCLFSIWEYGFICAQAEVGGPCSEDEGAPLVCGGIVLAIHSDVVRCEDVGIPRPFLRLDLAYEFVYGQEGASTARIAHALMFIAVFSTVKPHF